MLKGRLGDNTCFLPLQGSSAAATTPPWGPMEDAWALHQWVTPSLLGRFGRRGGDYVPGWFAGADCAGPILSRHSLAVTTNPILCCPEARRVLISLASVASDLLRLNSQLVYCWANLLQMQAIKPKCSLQFVV